MVFVFGKICCCLHMIVFIGLGTFEYIGLGPTFAVSILLLE